MKSKEITRKKNSEIYDWLEEHIRVDFNGDGKLDYFSDYSESFTLNDAGEIDCNVNIIVLNKIREFEYPFGTIFGDFIFEEGCDYLKSLKNCPKIVRGNFIIMGCDNLYSLEGCPNEIWGNFHCSVYHIETLNGVPTDIDGSFSCSSCYKLTSLEGCPNSKFGSIDIDNCGNLTSLIGLPEDIDKNFSIYDCASLISFKGFPKYIGNDILMGGEELSFSNNPKHKEEYKIYLAMWLELFESISNEERKDYIHNYEGVKDKYNKKPIIPIEILKEYGF